MGSLLGVKLYHYPESLLKIMLILSKLFLRIDTAAKLKNPLLPCL